MGDEKAIPPLTTDQIRESAGKWTLAGDVGLLGHLQNFSLDILQRANATESLITNLSEQVDTASTNFHNVSNHFLSLQNSQFLENRVYEDDSPTEDVKPIRPVGEEVESQQVTIRRYKDAVSCGLSLLDSHFDRVELLESSDDEGDPDGSNPTLVYRPKAAYTKPLPLLIGSAEWWADDSVGLGEYRENDDSEKLMSASESDSEKRDEIPTVQKRVRLSTTSSSSSEGAAPPKRSLVPSGGASFPENNTSAKIIGNPEDLFEPSGTIFDGEADLFGSIQKKPVAVNDKKMDESKIIYNDDLFEDEKDVEPKQSLPKVANDFTRELASKLGTVAKSQSITGAENVKKPKIIPTSSGKEPIKPVAPAKKPNFSGGLFEDDDDDPLFRTEPATKTSAALFDNAPGKASSLWDDTNDNLFGEPVAPPIANKLPSSQGGDQNKRLFDKGPSKSNAIGKASLFDDEDDDDDLFAKPSKLPSGTSKGLFQSVDLFSDDIDDDLFSTKKMSAKKDSTIPPILSDGATSSFTPPLKLPSVKFVTPGGDLGDNSGGMDKKMFFSTPAVDVTPQSVMSCSISDLQETPSMSEIQEEGSRDCGFIEDSASDAQKTTSDLGKDASSYKHSPALWFQPELSSTRKTIDTGYNTAGHQGSLSNAGAVSTVDNPAPSIVPSAIQRSNEDDLDIFGRKLGSKIHGASKQRTVSASDSDDLFAGPSKSLVPPKPTPRNMRPTEGSPGILSPNLEDDLFSKPLTISVEKTQPPSKMGRTQSVRVPLAADDDVEDLFVVPQDSNSKGSAIRSMGNSQNLASSSSDLFVPSSMAENKSKSVTTTAVTKSSSIFDDDDENDGLFTGGPVKKFDTVSVSSSRSSIFEEVATGKSTLPAIFGKGSQLKSTSKTVSLFDDIDDDCDLFSEGSKKAEGEATTTQDSVAKNALKQSNLGSIAEVSIFNQSDKLSPKVYPTPKSFAESSNVNSQGSVANFSSAGPTSLFEHSEQTSKLLPNKSLDTDKKNSLFAGEDALFGATIDNIAPSDKTAKSTETKILTEKDEANCNPLAGTLPTSLFAGSFEGESLFREVITISSNAEAVVENKEEKAEENTSGSRWENSQIGEHNRKESKLFDDSSDDDFLFSSTSRLQEATSSADSNLSTSKDKLETNSHLKSVEGRDNKVASTSIQNKSEMHTNKSSSVISKETNTKQVGDVKTDESEGILYGAKKKTVLPTTPKSRKPPSENLFEYGLSDDDDDLFGRGSFKIPPDKNEAKGLTKDALTEATDLPIDMQPKGSGRDETKEPLETVPKSDGPSPTVRLKPPSSLSVLKPAGHDESDGELVKTAVSKKIGKLNIPSNLKINPAALMPGAKLVKSDPVDVKHPIVQLENDEITKVPLDLSQPPVSEGILTNASKDRAKIQVKRRPQTRKARQEALRTSGIDFGGPDQSDSSPPSVSEKLVRSVDSSPSPVITSNPCSPSTDGEDCFNVPESGEHSEKDDCIFSGKQLPQDNVLFDGAPVISPSQPVTSYGDHCQETVKQSIDSFNTPLLSQPLNIPRQLSEDDLFVSSRETSQNETSPNPLFPKMKPKKQVQKPEPKSLFDDNDDDIDIFSGSSKPSNTEKKQEKSESYSAGGDVFVDPLGLLKRDDD